MPPPNVQAALHSSAVNNLFRYSTKPTLVNPSRIEPKFSLRKGSTSQPAGKNNGRGWYSQTSEVCSENSLTVFERPAAYPAPKDDAVNYPRSPVSIYEWRVTLRVARL